MNWSALGAGLGALAVALGAFGAHGLRSRVEARELEVFETAARYHLIHALVLVAVGLLAALASGQGRPDVARAADQAGWLLTAGVAVFSGSLYLLVLTGARKLGMVTPVGGLLLIGGWLALMRAAWLARG